MSLDTRKQNKHLIALRLPDDIKDYLRQECKKLECNQSELIRAILKNYIEKYT